MASIDELVNEIQLDKHEHKWFVFSTALNEVVILVSCECGAAGIVREHTKEEWALAYYAPSHPFRWADDGRVIELEQQADGTWKATDVKE